MLSTMKNKLEAEIDKTLETLTTIQSIRVTWSQNDAQGMLESEGVLIGIASFNDSNPKDECFRYVIGFPFPQDQIKAPWLHYDGSRS